MNIEIFHRRPRKIMILIGSSGGALFAGILLLLFYSSTSLSPEDAQKRVRQCIQRDISRSHMAIMKEKGIRIPDVQMATQWEKEINQAKSLEFLSTKVGRPIPDILFNPASPTYVVRVVFGDENRQHSPRYFWLSWDGPDRKISRFAWFFSI